MPSITVGFSRPKNKKFPIFSWIIRLVEWTSYSHVYIRWTADKLERDLIYQASGTQVNFISPNRFDLINETIHSFCIEISEDTKTKIVQYAIDNVGAPYGVKQVFGIGISRLYRLFGKKIKNPFSDGTHTYVCSELIGYIIEEFLGKDIKEDLEIIGPKGIYKFLKQILDK